MKIISHRGFWLDVSEKNKKTAFERSFKLGYGTETDIRDYLGELVISHDVANSECININDFFNLINANATKPLIFALNIKSDGLCELLNQAISSATFKYKHEFFVFDMSVPDLNIYIKNSNLKVFTRMSEVEKEPAWGKDADGIWLDSFGECWFDYTLLNDLLNEKKQVCVVSPELHNRDYLDFWENIKRLSYNENLIICTDKLSDAICYFEA